MSPCPAHGPSSAIVASSATRSWNAASRQRPASASRRAPERQLLAGQRDVAATEDRGEPLLWPQHRGALAPPGARGGNLDGLAPAPLGDLLARAVADAHHQRPLARGHGDARVGRRAAVRVHDGLEDAQRLGRLGLDIGGRKPALAGLVEAASRRRASRVQVVTATGSGCGGAEAGFRERSRPRRCCAPSVASTST